MEDQWKHASIPKRWGKKNAPGSHRSTLKSSHANLRFATMSSCLVLLVDPFGSYSTCSTLNPNPVQCSHSSRRTVTSPRARSPADMQTSLVAFQGIFNALVYGSTDAVKSAVAQELLVERCLKASGAGRGGGASGGSGDGGGTGFGGAHGSGGLDPEEEEEEIVAGVGMINVG